MIRLMGKWRYFRRFLGGEKVRIDGVVGLWERGGELGFSFSVVVALAAFIFSNMGLKRYIILSVSGFSVYFRFF